MKTHRLVLLLIAFAARCFAAAPDSLAGYILYESGNTIAHTSFQLAIALESGGTFKGLFRIGRAVLPIPLSIENPPDGTWSYRKIDDTTAELTLNGGGNSNEDTGKPTMKFTSDTEGTFAVATLPVGILQTNFRIAPISSRAPLSNCSNRSFVRAGGIAFTGFVVTPGGSGLVLVRAVGPGLAPFGITDPLRRPTLSIIRASDNVVMMSNDVWDGANAAMSITRTGAIVGAFPLSAGSKDSATIVGLAPGAYIAQVSSPDAGDAGQALIEVYLLP